MNHKAKLGLRGTFWPQYGCPSMEQRDKWGFTLTKRAITHKTCYFIFTLVKSDQLHIYKCVCIYIYTHTHVHTHMQLYMSICVKYSNPCPQMCLDRGFGLLKKIKLSVNCGPINFLKLCCKREFFVLIIIYYYYYFIFRNIKYYFGRTISPKHQE